MPESGLAALSPHDFEILCQDLLGSSFGVHFEAFTAGRDGGIDLRFLGDKPDPAGILVQCKHYLNSGYSALKSRIQSEALKAATLGARRYVLATSVRMTPGRKTELATILSSAGVNCAEVDIIGQEDLYLLLRKFPEIERTHYKLWLNSSAVLLHIINNGILVRSEGYLEELQHNAALFVENKSVDDALRLLNERHTCLISGAPGVGKTTLAEMLLLHAIAEGYTPVVVSSDIGEADQLYITGEKQIFLYDDFLGRTTTFERQGKNEDDRLVRFIRRVGNAANKRLVLTTREYILQQARMSFERLTNRDLDLTKYVLAVGVYTKRNRAHILYNHIYFSGVSEGARQSIRIAREYRPLINHPNYNPRLIEDAVALFAASGETDSAFGAFLLDAFDNPTELWAQVFSRQFTPAARHLLGMAALMEQPIPRDALERAHLAIRDATGTNETFEETMRVLEGTALDIGRQPSYLVDFTNPGVQDSVLTVLLPDPLVLRTAIEASYHFHQLVQLWTYASEPERGLPSSDHGQKWSALSSASHILTLVDRREPILRVQLRRLLTSMAEEFTHRLLGLIDTRLEVDGLRATRLSLVLGIADDLSSEMWRREIDAELETEIQRWTGFADKETVLELVGRVMTSGSVTADRREAVGSAAIRWFEGSLDGPKDFQLLSDLRDVLKPTHELMPDPIALRDEFASRLTEYLSDWEDADDSYALRSLLEDIENAAEALNLDLAGQVDIDWEYESARITERIEEMEQEDVDPDQDWRGKDDHYEDTSGRGDDEWVDSLFDTLNG